MRIRHGLVGATALTAIIAMSAVAQAGPIFLTGHDPDFHSQDSAGAAVLLSTGLNFAMGGLLNDNVHKFLWVESANAPDGGHRIGQNGLTTIGLIVGQDYDVARAADLATVNFSNYTAIGVASTFGGMLTSAEINALIARQADITAFINAGGGLFASAECDSGSNCNASNVAAPHGAMYGYLPIAASSVDTTSPYTVTAYGASLGLNNGDVNDPTHNSFAGPAGLNIVDTDAAGKPTTLAGVVRIGGGGFEQPVPEPASLLLLGSGLVGIGLKRWRKRRTAA
jgi:hypothetical protein